MSDAAERVPIERFNLVLQSDYGGGYEFDYQPEGKYMEHAAHAAAVAKWEMRLDGCRGVLRETESKVLQWRGKYEVVKERCDVVEQINAEVIDLNEFHVAALAECWCGLLSIAQAIGVVYEADGFKPGPVTAIVAEIKSLRAALKAAQEERDELQQLFDLQQTRMDEARMAWQAAHPEQAGVWPDLGKLLHWLLGALAAAREEAKRDREALRELAVAAEHETHCRDCSEGGCATCPVCGLSAALSLPAVARARETKEEHNG